MDEKKNNQSIDGMRGSDSGSSQSVDGFSVATPSRPAVEPNDTFNDADYSTEKVQESHENTGTQPTGQKQSDGSSNKGLKLLLTLFVILFLLAAGAAGYLYSTKDSEPAQPAANTSSLQQENEALKYDNKTLQTQLNQEKAKNKNITTTAQQLKTKCGNGCSAIVIPL